MSKQSGKGPGAYSLLRHRNFRYFLLARVSTAVAYQMLSVAVGWQMYSLTRSTFYLGLVGLMQFLPMLLLTLPAGNISDRRDRKTIVRICQVAETAGILLLAAGSFAGRANKESLLLIVFLIGAARAFEAPSMQALLPGLVDKEIFPQAVALATSTFQTATIVGPALGGLLFAFGPGVVFACVGSLYFLASIFIGLVKSKPRVGIREPVSVSSVLAGLSFIFGNKVVLGAISLDLFAVLLGGATALLPVYAKEILNVGAVGLGVLRSAPAAGSLLMSLYLARSPLKHRVGKKMFIAVIIFGLATIVFAVSKSFLLSICALVVLGVADTISMVVRGSLVQLQTPDEMRGRVSSVNYLFIGTSNQLGEFESGITASWLGVVPSVIVGGIGTIVVALAWMGLFPPLAKMDSLSGPAARSIIPGIEAEDK